MTSVSSAATWARCSGDSEEPGDRLVAKPGERVGDALAGVDLFEERRDEIRVGRGLNGVDEVEQVVGLLGGCDRRVFRLRRLRGLRLRPAPAAPALLGVQVPRRALRFRCLARLAHVPDELLVERKLQVRAPAGGRDVDRGVHRLAPRLRARRRERLNEDVLIHRLGGRRCGQRKEHDNRGCGAHGAKSSSSTGQNRPPRPV
jgi:hypothetical protein